ncbi:uncharacterized protein LOC120352074 [Nilaparvata lugens]|uniref:uncharacterized protein LOC120352074 n=1 Tax=Nilaparvata lugens TaxID=108931 RepID=UPI00193D37E5|nr:uncharacterized protein LOC120352074 [Nilaparvata lugens]
MSVSGDSRYYGRTFIKELIELYRSHPCLWKVSCKELYLNRKLKKIAYAELIEKMKEVEKDANKEMVCKKLHGLRSSFRREYRKVEDSKRLGNGDLYETRLWYFDLMMFIADQDHVNTSLDCDYSQNNEEAGGGEEDDFEYKMDGDDSASMYMKAPNIRDYCDTAMIIERPSDGESSTSVPRIVSLQDKKRKRREINFDNQQNLEEEFLNAITPVAPQMSKDDFDTFGAFVASELRQLRSEEIRKRLKKKITKAIVEAWEDE